jgi:hypothetical protein
MHIERVWNFSNSDCKNFAILIDEFPKKMKINDIDSRLSLSDRSKTKKYKNNFSKIALKIFVLEKFPYKFCFLF